MKRWAGPLITSLILAGVALILVMNLNLGPGQGPSPGLGQTPTHLGGPKNVRPDAPVVEARAAQKPKNFRGSPIGEEVEANGMRVAAVWLPPIQMDGQGMGGSDVIHMEADV